MLRGDTDIADTGNTPNLSGKYVANWDTTTVPNGTYTLASVAADQAGLTGRSTNVTITVQN